MVSRLLLTALAASSSTKAAADSATNITVSGLSGGAFFAVQFHVAFSARVQGVGVLAGGPYYCALNNIEVALGRCMRFPDDINVSELVTVTRSTYATTHTIDNPDNLLDDQVWVLSALQDTVVETGVVQAAADYYTAFVADPATQIESVFNTSGEHSFLTVDQGSSCLFKGEPYINACDYDAAGEILQHLNKHTLTTPPAGARVDGLDLGQLLTFDQAPYLEPGFTLEAAGLYDVGYMYAPDACVGGGGGVSGEGCRVHVAFHGCEMTVPDIGQQFVMNAGYNSWAAANDVIVLYPQATRTTLNPKGCFDWWGYTGADYASKLGCQMSAVDKMVTGIASASTTAAQQ